MATTRRDPLDQAHADLELLVKKITTGTADRPRRTRIIDVALTRMEEWAATDPVRLDREGPRGGTSATIEQTERAEIRDVIRNAATDHATALTLMRTIATATEQLYLITRRYTAPVDTSKLPKKADTIPGCVSCARTKRKGPLTLGGHFAAIANRYAAERLCRWCGDHHRTGALPPVEACDIYHRQGAQAAGRWLARQNRKGA
jgi:hypothetical protein